MAVTRQLDTAVAGGRPTTPRAQLIEARTAHVERQAAVERERDDIEVRFQRYLRTGEAIGYDAVAVCPNTIGSDTSATAAPRPVNRQEAVTSPRRRTGPFAGTAAVTTIPAGGGSCPATHPLPTLTVGSARQPTLNVGRSRPRPVTERHPDQSVANDDQPDTRLSARRRTSPEAPGKRRPRSSGTAPQASWANAATVNPAGRPTGASAGPATTIRSPGD